MEKRETRSCDTTNTYFSNKKKRIFNKKIGRGGRHVATARALGVQMRNITRTKGEREEEE